MARHIRITVGGIHITAVALQTPTAAAVLAVLPITGRALTWGDEVYFTVPITAAREADAREVVKAGEIAFWPEGNAIAIGFGPTPISRGNEIRLASPANIWATALGDVRTLSTARDGDRVEVAFLTEAVS